MVPTAEQKSQRSILAIARTSSLCLHLLWIQLLRSEVPPYLFVLSSTFSSEFGEPPALLFFQSVYLPKFALSDLCFQHMCAGATLTVLLPCSLLLLLQWEPLTRSIQCVSFRSIQGSILASLSTLLQMWISKPEDNEWGHLLCTTNASRRRDFATHSVYKT